MKQLVSLIKSDLKRIDSKCSVKTFLRWYYFPQGTCFPYIVWLRILHFCKETKFRKYFCGWFAYIRYRMLGFKYGISVNSNIYIGAGLNIVHSYGVFLNCKSIGDNFTVFPGVVLGSLNTKMENCIPTIGNDVTIYSHSIVVGSVTIDDGATIGANAFVNFDVEKGKKIMGFLAKEVGK